ncbi:hypothetical protein BDV09DRAFT_175371 [Aspergillus tetrazonus]
MTAKTTVAREGQASLQWKTPLLLLLYSAIVYRLSSLLDIWISIDLESTRPPELSRILRSNFVAVSAQRGAPGWCRC